MNKLIPIASIFLWFSCGPSKEELRQQAIAEMNIKIETLKTKKRQECEAQAFMEAEVFVDSIIEAMFLNPINDTLYSPPVPPKPKYVSVDSSVFNSQSSVKPVVEN